MPLDLTRRQAMHMVYYVMRISIDQTEFEDQSFGSNRRFALEKGLFRIYVINDYKQNDCRYRVGVQDKLSGEAVEVVLTPAYDRDCYAGKTQRLKFDRERREYWVRTVGPEEAKKEVDEIGKRLSRRPWMEGVPKEYLSTQKPERSYVNDHQ